MGNQNSNQVQLASMRNLLVDAEGSKPGESAEGAKPDSSPLVIPNSATVQQDASILKKKSKAKSKSKEKRSLTPVKQTTVKIVGVSDDPGLSSLAIDLRKSQVIHRIWVGALILNCFRDQKKLAQWISSI